VVPDIPSATCPPYDVINEVDRRRYRTLSEHNMVRLLLAEPGDPTYTEAARLLNTWRSTETLRTDSQPRFYLYRQIYRDDAGRERSAAGIIGALAVLPLGERVLPHEETMPKTKADRLAVLTSTRANLDLIIGLTPAAAFAEHLSIADPPRLAFEVEGVHHALVDITDPDRIAAISSAVDSQPVAIADGHHRYTTALQYRDGHQGPGPWDSIMALLVPAEGSGLTIGPTHRVFPSVTFDPARLENAFELAPAGPQPPDPPGTIILVPGRAHRANPLGLVARPTSLEALPGPWRQASPAVARELLYPLLDVDESEAAYFADPEEARAALQSRPEGAVAMMATVPEDVISAATATGLRFPQKSTFFMPKPRSGLVVRCFEDA